MNLGNFRQLATQGLLAVVPIGFALILLMTWPYFQRPPEICEVSALSVSAEVEGQLVEDIEKSIEVRPGKEGTVEIGMLEECSGNLSVNWSLPFTDGMSQVQITSEAMAYEEFRVTARQRDPR